MAGLGSQELYRMVLDSLPAAVCAVDREGKVILWNEGAERVTGYLRRDQVTQVRRFADQRLRKPDAPQDPSNRRISLIVQCLEKKPSPEAAGGENGEGEGGADGEERVGKEVGKGRKRARKRKNSEG